MSQLWTSAPNNDSRPLCFLDPFVSSLGRLVLPVLRPGTIHIGQFVDHHTGIVSARLTSPPSAPCFAQGTERLKIMASRARLPRPPSGPRRQAAEHEARKAPIAERSPEMPNSIQLAHDIGIGQSRFVRRESGSGRISVHQRLTNRLGRQHPALHRIVDALQIRHVQQSGRVADKHRPVHEEAGHRRNSRPRAASWRRTPRPFRL